MHQDLLNLWKWENKKIEKNEEKFSSLSSVLKISFLPKTKTKSHHNSNRNCYHLKKWKTKNWKNWWTKSNQIPIAIQSAIKICFPIYFHNFRISININISDIIYVFVFFKKKKEIKKWRNKKRKIEWNIFFIIAIKN